MKPFGSERARARILRLTFRTRIYVPTLVSPTCNFQTFKCSICYGDSLTPNDVFEANVHAEVKNIRTKINDNAVSKRASELNGGRKCEIEHPPAWGRGSLMGCANYHARIRFPDDDSVWLIRVPRTNSSIPQSLIDYLIRSEYATLKFLETTKVPAPRAFDHGIAGDKNNKAGVIYILMEEMAGKTWKLQGPRGKRFADDKDKERIWNGLADILIELQHHPFSEAGSLLLGPSVVSRNIETHPLKSSLTTHSTIGSEG